MDRSLKPAPPIYFSDACRTLWVELIQELLSDGTGY
jgi:hypothetical protein